ncbi:hypothetical protein ACFE04_006534 [Oxalis oulophora]
MKRILLNILEKLTISNSSHIDSTTKIKGTVVLMKKNVLDFKDLKASILDDLHELVGKNVSLQLISSVNGDPSDGSKGKLGEKAYLEEWITTITPLIAGEAPFKVTFDYDPTIGFPGAFLIKSNHHSEFYLKSLTLEDFPGHGKIYFDCDSWVYPDKYYNNKGRVFFVNKAYLPSDTPGPLCAYRIEELVQLRGTGDGERQEWDRVYDYAFYNDLGDPDKGEKYARPVLGGSDEYPYPRRGRTGRPPSKTDPNTESRLPLIASLDIYVPRDERFGHLKMSDFLGYTIKSIGQVVQPAVEGALDTTSFEFDSLDELSKLYEGGIKLPDRILETISENMHLELLKQIMPTDGEGLFKYPVPQVIKEDKHAWSTDEEFAREMLAGVNPVHISRLQEFPPTSKLDSQNYGNQNSTITKQDIMNKLDGLTLNEAIDNRKLFILDHHDVLMPFIRKINKFTKAYASRTILFLKNDGTLMPLAIELSLPHPDGDQFGGISKVYTPASHGVEGSMWQLAKAYVTVNDSGFHQLISHWLNTHAVIEPFIIATNRQLSVLHPIYKLLHPHFSDTMNINAIARQILNNAGGLVESLNFPSKYSMEITSAVYKNWVFTEQALPEDLKKRGIAVEDPEAPHGLRLMIKDYPFAVDGLEIWFAINMWVEEYCSLYYDTDEEIQKDDELQSWWKEIREQGHGDKKHEPWWPNMQTKKDLIESCTIIIWIASALHAAVNFGQYPIGGYIPNRPAISRRFMPEKGTPEYSELELNPEKVFLNTFTSPLSTVVGVSLLQILSMHSTDEVYLGQRGTSDWTSDNGALRAFEKFGKKLADIEKKIMATNRDEKLKNRMGVVKVAYTLLFPSSECGLTGRGIPNSVSI